MKQKKPSHSSVYNRLVKLDDKIWKLFSNYETDRALTLNHQFQYLFFKNEENLNLDDIYLHHLLAKQNIIYNTLGGVEDEKNSTIAQDTQKYIYYETDVDTHEVLNFIGFLKISNHIPIKKIFQHIDWYIRKYEKSSEPISILFNYGDDKPNDVAIKFEIHYENDGVFQIEIDKFGVFRGETLSFLKLPHESFDYEEDFLKKFNDIYTYFQKVLK